MTVPTSESSPSQRSVISRWRLIPCLVFTIVLASLAYAGTFEAKPEVVGADKYRIRLKWTEQSTSRLLIARTRSSDGQTRELAQNLDRTGECLDSDVVAGETYTYTLRVQGTEIARTQTTVPHDLVIDGTVDRSK